MKFEKKGEKNNEELSSSAVSRGVRLRADETVCVYPVKIEPDKLFRSAHFNASYARPKLANKTKRIISSLKKKPQKNLPCY